MAGKRTLALIYTRLDDQEQVMETFGEISSIMQQRNIFWTEGSLDGEQYSHQDVGNINSVAKSSDANTHTPAFKPENLREEWFSEWVNISSRGLGRELNDHTVALGPQLTEGTNPYMNTLLRWLKSSITQGELTTTEMDIILFGEGAKDDDIEANLEQSTPGTLKARIYGLDKDPNSSERWEDTFMILKDWLLHKAKYNETKRHVLLGRLQTERLDSLVHTNRFGEILHEANRLLALVPELCDEAQQQFKGSTVNWRNVACLAKKTILAQQNTETLWNEQHPDFIEIVDMYKVSLQESRDRGSLMNEAAILLFIAQHYSHGALLLRPAAIGPFFEYLDAADTVYNKSRESWKVLKGWSKVEKLLSAVQEQLRLTIAPLAVSVIWQFPENEDRARGLWSMVQMAKSNGLGWLMRTNDSSERRRVDDSKRLDVDFEQLPTLTPEELEPISEGAGGNVVYVDWYNGSSPGREMPNPVIISLTSSGSMNASTISMTWKEINTVIDDFSFEESELRKPDALKSLQRLNSLLEPLAALTSPGQTLVFSSIGALHRIPLHALTLDGALLIKRNPIVYCSSLTVLNVLFKTRKAAEQTRASVPTTSTVKDVTFQARLFGDPPSQPGKKALLSLAKKFDTEAQIGDALTSSNLTTALLDPNLNLLHYHGHVTFQEGDPKDHGLELDDGRFSLRDVFNLESRSSQSAYHVTLLGCGSGMSKTTVSNDVIGLVPAFLYSGAASTVSTLWPFDDKDAAMYTRCFYEDFERVMKEGGGQVVVDLAEANQKAVLKILEKRPALYNWGCFVVNGWWMMRAGQ
ncbi:MAG: hypothetical protein Q9166_006539 [cf. Caloplaca sp. 2 TL-2023]